MGQDQENWLKALAATNCHAEGKTLLSEVQMKKTIALLALSFLVLLGTYPLSHGAGFLIYEHGAAAMAMGGAFVAIANNPTAIFHNPAGLAWLEGTQISFGTTLIRPQNSLSLPHWPDPTYKKVDGESQWFYPSTFYISHKINDKLAAGFGFFTPYGLGTKWPEDYPLKYIAYRDDMKTFFFNPTIAYKVSENLSVGVGVSYVYSTLSFDLVEHEEDLVDLAPLIGLPVLASVDIPVSLEANGSGWGLNAGALYRGENFSLGFNWRGGFKIKFKGDLGLESPQLQIPDPYSQLVPAEVVSIIEAQIATQIPSEGGASTSFSFPHILGVGVALNLTESLILSADVHYVLWSSFDEYVVDVDLPPPFTDKEVNEDWEDSFVFRGGIQYSLNENFALRVGLIYDQTPQPEKSVDPVLPDSDRWGFTGGFGYKVGNFVINVAYQYELFNDRESPNREILLHPLTGANLGKGIYSATAHLFGISLGFRL